MKKELLYRDGTDPDARVDAKVKVTGSAKFAAEYDIPGLVYGVLVTSTITKGRITNIDTTKADRAPGVISVVTHLNRPKVPGWDTENSRQQTTQEYRLFYNDQIVFNDQPVALAIADTLERAQYAASVVEVQYEKQTPETDFLGNISKAVVSTRNPDYKRGDPDAIKNAPVKIEAEYITPVHVHNAMEPHAAIAIWDGDEKLTLYNKTQWVGGVQQNMMQMFKLKKENIHVISKFVGGAFGSASRSWPHEVAAVMGAKKINKPLKVVLTRGQMFNMVGHRPTAWQKVSLGASADGKLVGAIHEAIAETSAEQWTERIPDSTKILYDCANVSTVFKMVVLDVGTPTFTRGPGETTGVFAIECAMDELANALKMDPIELRMKNYATVNPENKLPWSAKYLNECYQKGAESFGWNKRNPTPRSVKNGEWYVGMGMSTAIYGGSRAPATAKAILMADGTLVVQTATADTGPGTATIMTQIAADGMKLPLSKVRFDWGDSFYPPAPGEFGSMTAASVGSAVHDVSLAMKQKLFELVKENSVFHTTEIHDVKFEDVIFEDGALMLSSDHSKKISYAQILERNNLPLLEITKQSQSGPERSKYAVYSFGASFVEVNVHPLTGVVKVTKVTSVIDNGKIINKKTARNQVLGSVVWGISMSLMEEGIMDHRYGRYVNNNFADYHVPVNADIPPTDVIFIDKEDPIIDPLGAKGLGEIPLVGFAAALANAVFNATGKRIRQLPITPDKLL